MTLQTDIRMGGISQYLAFSWKSAGIITLPSVGRPNDARYTTPSPNLTTPSAGPGLISCSVYPLDGGSVFTQSRQHQSSMAQMAQHMKYARKGKRKGREREGERRKKCWVKSQKKKKKKKNLHVHTFSHCDPCAMTFCEFKN